MNTSEIRAKARELRSELDAIAAEAVLTEDQIKRGEQVSSELRKLEGMEKIAEECEHQRALDLPVRKSVVQSENYPYPDTQSEARTGTVGVPVFLRSASDLAIPRVEHPFKSTGEFIRAITSGRYHPGLLEAAARANTLSPKSQGGYLAPPESTTDIFRVMLETSTIMGKVRTYPADSVRQIHFPAIKDNDRSGGLLFGGMRMYWLGEAAEITEANPKARRVTLEPKGVKGFVSLSNELVHGSNDGLKAEFERMIGEACAWTINNAFLNGDGAGKPIGVLDAACPCTIEVAKETSQAADSIVYPNLVKMYSRMIPAARNNAEWFITNDAVPQLLSLTIPIGTAGDHIPALRESDGKFTLLGRPVNFSEKMAALGDRGDILFADWGYYASVIVGGITVAGSEHAMFQNDCYAIRATAYIDGAPLLESAITPFKGSLSTSAFVTLAAR